MSVVTRKCYSKYVKEIIDSDEIQCDIRWIIIWYDGSEDTSEIEEEL